MPSARGRHQARHLRQLCQENNPTKPAEEEAHPREGCELFSTSHRAEHRRQRDRAIGKTPGFFGTRLVRCGGTVACKLESMNPCTRQGQIAYNMITQAEQAGKIVPGRPLWSQPPGTPAWASPSLPLPSGTSSCSPCQRRCPWRGARSGFWRGARADRPGQGMKGAVEKAEEIASNTADAYVLQQFENPSNPKIHYETTGPEIWEDTAGHVDIFVSGVGTGGTITGAGGFLKSKKADVKVVAVEPSESPILSGGSPGPHKIQGIGAGFVPHSGHRPDRRGRQGVLGRVCGDGQRLALEEGIFAGIPGAAVTASVELARGQRMPASSSRASSLRSGRGT